MSNSSCTKCGKESDLPACNWCKKIFCHNHAYYKNHKCKDFSIDRASVSGSDKSDLINIKKSESK